MGFAPRGHLHARRHRTRATMCEHNNCTPCELCLLVTCVPLMLGLACCDSVCDDCCGCASECLCGVVCCPCALTEAAAAKWREKSDAARARRAERWQMEADKDAPPAAKMEGDGPRENAYQRE